MRKQDVAVWLKSKMTQMLSQRLRHEVCYFVGDQVGCEPPYLRMNGYICCIVLSIALFVLYIYDKDPLKNEKMHLNGSFNTGTLAWAGYVRPTAGTGCAFRMDLHCSNQPPMCFDIICSRVLQFLVSDKLDKVCEISNQIQPGCVCSPKSLLYTS